MADIEGPLSESSGLRTEDYRALVVGFERPDDVAALPANQSLDGYEAAVDWLEYWEQWLPDGLDAQLRSQVMDQVDPRARPSEISGESIALLATTAIIYKNAVAPFLEAFASKLGQSAGEAVPRALRRAWVNWRGEIRALEVEQKQPDAVTTVLLPDPFTDEARLALLDLDMSDEGLRGATLGWSVEAQEWTRVEDLPFPLGTYYERPS